MEDAYQILDYLPVSYKSEGEQEYIDFLWDSFESNYRNEKFQFAFLAYHMLYMSFVYFNVWQIRNNDQKDFDNALIGFGKDLEKEFDAATSPFTFSVLKEKSIFRFFKLLGCGNDKIGNYAKIVDYRNDIAHSNGNIFYHAQQAIDEKIEEILKQVEQIQENSKAPILRYFERFLIESWNSEEREYIDDLDQIREVLIHKNYLSQKDIEYCCHFDIDSLSAESHFEERKSLFQFFVNEYTEETIST